MLTRILIINLITTVSFLCPAMGKGLLLNIHYSESELMFDSVKMSKELSAIDFCMASYLVDNSVTIEKHAVRILDIIHKYQNREAAQPVILLTDRMSSFVGLEAISKDTAVAGLVTLSGAFCNGDDFLYDNVSMKKNMEFLDSVSFDHSKEIYLEKIYRMIQARKVGEKIKPIRNADITADNLYRLLNSPYGVSMLGFSLASRLSMIKSLIVPMIDDYGILMMHIDLMNLSCIGNMYGLKYTFPLSFDKDNVVSNVIRQVQEIIK